MNCCNEYISSSLIKSIKQYVKYQTIYKKG